MSIKISFKHSQIFSPKKGDNPVLVQGTYHLPGNNGCVVLLIHGLTGTPNEMRYVANLLNRRGYSVVCPRLANHGQPMGILKLTRWQTFYGSVRETFLKIQSQYRGERIFAAGLCMGGLLALLLAEEFGDQVAGVSCLSPTLFYDGWGIPWYRFLLPVFLWTPILREISYYKENPPYGIKDEAIRERVHKYYSRATLDDMEDMPEHGYPYVPASLLYQNHLLIKYVIKKLSSVDVPVQLIQAKEDDTTSVKNSNFIYNQIGSKMKELVLLDDSYHLITVDRERDKVGEKMDAFFSHVKERTREPVLGRTPRKRIRLSDCVVFFDFDNTITTFDVFDEVLQRFSVDTEWQKLEEAWQAGKLSSKDCLEGQLRSVRVTREALSRFLATVAIDKGFFPLLDYLKGRRVPTMILSDNFSFLVKEILRHNGIEGVRTFCNRIRFSRGRLIPSFPYRDRACPRCAHCKKRHLLNHPDKTLIYVGDGLSDVCPAQEADIVFAKGSLAEHLNKTGKPCIPFNGLEDVHKHLMEFSGESESEYTRKKDPIA